MSEEKSKQKKQEEEGTALDPFSQLFQFYDLFARSWSKVLSEAVSSQSFAESLGQQMESSLDAMALMRQQTGELMEQYLQQMNLPTHKEIVSIAERLTNLEMAVDDLDAKLDETLDLLKAKKKKKST